MLLHRIATPATPRSASTAAARGLPPPLCGPIVVGVGAPLGVIVATEVSLDSGAGGVPAVVEVTTLGGLVVPGVASVSSETEAEDAGGAAVSGEVDGSAVSGEVDGSVTSGAVVGTAVVTCGVVTCGVETTTSVLVTLESVSIVGCVTTIVCDPCVTVVGDGQYVVSGTTVVSVCVTGGACVLGVHSSGQLVIVSVVGAVTVYVVGP